MFSKLHVLRLTPVAALWFLLLGASPLPPSNDLLRPELPFVPFPYVDLETTEALTKDTMMLTPDAQGNLTILRKAGDYYAEINTLEQKLCLLGYSMHNVADEEIISRLPIDELLMQRQAAAQLAATQPIDPEVMTPVRSARATAEAAKSRIEAEAASQLSALYASVSGGATPPSVTLAPLDPEVIARPSSDLNNVLTKQWDFEKGEHETFAATASATLTLSGSLRAAEATTTCRADVWAFAKEYNVAYADVQGRVDASSTGLGGSVSWKVLFLGADLYHGDIKGGSNVRSDSADNDKVFPIIHEGQDYYFSIGPVPMSGSIGIAGTFDYDWGVGLAGLAVTGTGQAAAKLGGYASLQADLVVAQAGVGGELTIVDDLIKIEGGVGVDADSASGEPRVVATVRGTNTMTVLKGELFAFASAVVPAAGLPPWEKKTWRKILYGFDGVSTGEQSLFNFSKVVSSRGYLLTGAPREEDYAEVNVEQELDRALQETVTAVGQDQTVMRGQTLATVLHSRGSLVDNLNNPINH